MNPALVSPPSTPTRAEEEPTREPRQEFLSRDLSWLEFNRRVLQEALDERTPLLERLRFLGIFTSNLDEFVMKRVAPLRRQAAGGTATPTPDGRTPAEVLAAVRKAVQPMLARQHECFVGEMRPRLCAAGIHLLQWRDLTAAERDVALKYFQSTVFPVLTPLAVDPGSPFPFIDRKSVV